jgi:phosphate transport system permease protein
MKASQPTARFEDDIKQRGFDRTSFFFTWLTGGCAFLIVGILAIILINISWQGLETFSWRFVSSDADQDMFDATQAGVLPMIVGTSARVILMTLFVMPVGVITAIYLTEYASPTAFTTRFIRGAVTNLAGVPSIVIGLFGLGFFINFVGSQVDLMLHPEGLEAIWRSPALIWASLTLAVMTLPVVIIATEEAFRSVPAGLREASMALGASKLQTIARIILPQSLPGILTGGILAVSRAAGEVAPILFTGAAFYMAGYPTALTDQFMDLGYHVFILSTQSPDIEKTRPILYATVITLLALTFALNASAIILRARIRKKMRLMS